MSRLFLKLYAWCFTIFVVTTIVSLFAPAALELPPFARVVGRMLQYPAHALSAVAGDAGGLTEEVRAIHERTGTVVAVYDATGGLLAASSDDPPRCTTPAGSTFEFQSGRFAVPLVHQGQPRGLACFEPDITPNDGGSALLLSAVLVLLCTGASAVLLHRSLAVPLRRLSAAATQMARGRLDVRVRMQRDDEFGRTAAAFDEMANRVEASLRAQRELVAGVSHELRTPLARMQLALDLAPAEFAADPTFDELRQDVDELKQLVQRVLEASRPGSGSLLDSREFARSHARSSVDLVRVVQRAVEGFGRLHPECTIALDLCATTLECSGDEGLLSSLLDNLLENARKFSSADRPIEVRLARDGDLAILQVEDHGIGMGPADLERVFEPFFRADRSRSRSTGGFGLGLTLVKRIAEAHDAEVSIASESGEGTTVTVTFGSVAAITRDGRSERPLRSR